MCTQYLNANVVLFKSVTKNNNDIVGFYEPFDCITTDTCNGVLEIGEFNIITYITLLESSNRKAGNVLDKREKLEVKLRLTKCTKDETERLSIDLDDFTIDTKNSNDIIIDACVPYLNYKRITHIGSITLDINNPKGSYVIKVLVRTSSDDKYTVQSIQHLQIK